MRIAGSSVFGRAAQTNAVPLLFVLLWSSGFVGARLGLPDAPPFHFLAMRFGLVVLILMPVMLARLGRLPRQPRMLLHLAVVGVLVHGVYLGGVFLAISMGLGAGTSALIVSLQPLLVGALAGRILGEKVAAAQWLGLALGLLGCALVVAPHVVPGSMATIGLCLLSLGAITAGTLYQKRFCTGVDLQAATIVQFGAAFLAVLPLALIEPSRIHATPAFVFALAWLVLVLSVGAVSLLLFLIRQGDASRVSSLFFLVPPVTALMAYGLFDEELSRLQLVGMVVAVLGVAMVNRARTA